MGGELVIPVITSTTVFIVALLFISLPLAVISTWTAPFTRPFKDVKGFEKFGKVHEGVKSFIVQGSKREKLIVAAFTLTITMAFLSWSLVLLGCCGISVLNKVSAFLVLLLVINILGAFYFGRRVEQALKKYAETVQT